MLKNLINGFYRDSFECRERAYFYVSDVGKCPRALYFHFKDVPRERPDPRVLRIFDEGEYTHRRLLSVLYSLGIVQASEVHTPPDDLVHGRADAIVTLEGEPYVVEFKSSAGYKFSKLKKPREDHVDQTQLYMHYFNIPRGIILYENKNTQHLKEFSIDYSRERAEELIKGFEFLKNQIEKNIIPDVPPDIPKWRCRYCEYRPECLKQKDKSEK